MRIRWTQAAADDLEQIHDFLIENHPHLVRSTIAKLYESIRSLKEMPHRGRLGREEGTRELLFIPMPYIVAYRVREEAIEILHIQHTSRKQS
jgi:toxin ParE1/3/4